MTILSKKKVSQGKTEEASDSSTHGGAHPNSLHLEPIPNHAQNSESICDERLNTARPLRGEKRSTHSPHFDDFENHESGPSQSKRRHRASPLRTNQYNLQEINSSTTAACSAGTASPNPGTSGGDDMVSVSGYNSGDEYGPRDSSVSISEAEWANRDRWFEKIIRRKGFIIKQMEEDGSCLFRAVADQVYGDQEMHAVLRHHCMNYIEANGDYFSQYVTEDLSTYVNRKRHACVHGNHIEIQAMSNMYNKPIEVYSYGIEPINIFLGKNKNSNEPIRISYHRGSHYNSVVDPYRTKISSGLGLPNYATDLVDKNLVPEAISQSERLHVEQAMLEDKLRATDWEATNEAIVEQIARESYLQWVKENEQRNKSMQCSASATCSSATVTSNTPRSSPRSCILGLNSPLRAGSHLDSVSHTETPRSSTKTLCHESAAGSSSASCSYKTNPNILVGFQLYETASFINHLSPEVFGLSDWEEANNLAQVLAKSQEEYIDCLRKNQDDCAEDTSVNDSMKKVEYGEPSTSR